MAVEKAPYINYTEITTYQGSVGNGSEIPIFVVKSEESINVSDITSNSMLKFRTYKEFKDYFSISDDETEYNALSARTKAIDTVIKDFFKENSMYGEGDYGLQVPYIYIIKVGNEPTTAHYLKALEVSEIKRETSVLAFPDTSDLSFMSVVDTKLREETKTGMLRIGYCAIAGKGSNKALGMGDVVIPKSSPSSYTAVVEGYKDGNKFYSDSNHTDEITPLTENTVYLDVSDNSTYKYDGSSLVELEANILKDKRYFTDEAYYNLLIPSTKVDAGGTNETFDAYCKRVSFVTRHINSSRIALIEKEDMGKTIARICSTPYYIEPGYLPYTSVKLGVFKEYTSEERDELFGSGLIFNEDDYTLSEITPRICLATSTAWGVENHEERTTDALIHARRNVDHQVREIFKIVAPQLKRNETSVNIRMVENQIDVYLNSELDKGRIMEYAFNVHEASYSPYTLMVVGKIIPVNSTLAIEFENTIGSPYAIASDYI